MIQSIESYLNYFAGIRRRTIGFIEAIPEEKIDWQPNEEDFTCGEIVRHLGSVQQMNWRAFIGRPLNYVGHDKSFGATKQESLAYLEKCNQEGIQLLENQLDENLLIKREDTRGNPTTAWRFLMATVEHEVHHRSQLATYITLMGLEPPQLYGVYMENLPKT